MERKAIKGYTASPIYDKVGYSCNNAFWDTMKRDMDFFREILLEIEESGDPGLDPIAIHVAFISHTDKEINYHLELLQQSGFINAERITQTTVVIDWEVKGLTNKGHDLLDASRHGTIWQRAKDITISKGGNFTLNFLFQTTNTLVSPIVD